MKEPSDNMPASSPCSLDQVDPAYSGLPFAHSDAMRWRRPERERLIAARLAIPADVRASHGKKIIAALADVTGDLRGKRVGVYWPFRGEPDLREWMAGVIAQGGTCALPVVVQPKAPLEFRDWHPGCAMERGVWNIPIPSDSTVVLPDVVISPLVGFDPGFYRLGYGGGFYDRTLAAMPKKPLVIGVGYDMAALPTIHPQPHDIPMDHIITESGLRQR